MRNLSEIDFAEGYVRKIFELLPQNMWFHNWRHTAEVTDTAMKICDYHQLDQAAATVIKLAALFHDTGYVKSYRRHEDHSINFATKFFTEFNLDRTLLTTVADCIEATRIPQSPRTELAEILCDADLAHFGSPDYFFYAAMLRKEWSVWLDKIYEDKVWNQENLSVLRKHRYKTDYGRNYLQPVKEQNILIMKSELSI